MVSGHPILLARARVPFGCLDGMMDDGADNSKRSKQARNTEKLIRCFTALEDYKGMEQLLGVLPDGSDMLNDLGKRFTAVGLSEPAVSAYIKANNVTAAVNSCVVLHQWDKAVELAEQYSFQQIEVRRFLLLFCLVVDLNSTAHGFMRCAFGSAGATEPILCSSVGAREGGGGG